MQTTLIQKRSSKKLAPKIPDYLIYEVVRGKPIYYKGYKDVLAKTKTFEEIKLESQLKAGLKAAITATLYLHLKNFGYQIATGELGINISKQDKRGADLSVFKAENWSWDDKFSNLPPEVVIEIDVRAELEDLRETDYISQKIRDYLAFGVKKVIWIFTKERLVHVATATPPWLTYDWSADIEVLDGVTFNLNDLIK